jgi:hypothetical protein
MKNWILEDEEDELLSCGASAGAGAADTELSEFEQEYADALLSESAGAPTTPSDVRSPPSGRAVVSSAAPRVGTAADQSASRLPLMIRQEERPQKKKSLGASSASTAATPAQAGAAADAQSWVVVGSADESSPQREGGRGRERTASPISGISAADLSADPPEDPARGTPSNAESRSPAAASVDGSILGDYCHWIAGARLSAGGMRGMYSGLYATALDEAEAGMAGKVAVSGSLSAAAASQAAGQKTPTTPGHPSASPAGDDASSSSSSLVSSFLPLLLGGVGATSPPPKTTPAPSADAAATADGQAPPGSGVVTEVYSGDLARGRSAVTSVRVLEIVLRPDVQLKEVMTSCYKSSRVTTLRY